MTVVHTRMHWEDTARKDAINMLRDAIREMETHPDRFLEYMIQVDPVSAYPRLHRISVAFEIPQEPESSEVAESCDECQCEQPVVSSVSGAACCGKCGKPLRNWIGKGGPYEPGPPRGAL